MPVFNKADQIKQSLIGCLKAGPLNMQQIRARVSGTHDLVFLTLKRNPDTFELVEKSRGKSSSVWKLKND